MKLDLDKVDPASLQTSFWYGTYGSGKTFFTCTFPRVAWFGTEREGGFKTIKYMDPSDFYDGVKPQIFLIKTPAEFMAHLHQDVIPQVRTGRIQTIVLELSVYSDEMIRARKDEQSWQKYADLETHIMFVDELLKKTPGVRVCYNALAQAEFDNKKPSGVLMAGRALPNKLPALIDVVGYLRAEEQNGVIHRVLHLTPYANFPARHRYGNHLPNVIRNPTYRKLENLLKGVASVDADGNVILKGSAPALAALAPLK